MGSGTVSGTLLGLAVLTFAPPPGIRGHLADAFTPGCISTVTSRNVSREQRLECEHRPRGSAGGAPWVCQVVTGTGLIQLEGR